MTYSKIILLAAKKIGVSASLLVAICTHETKLQNIQIKDGGSPSYGICQVKLETASMLGFKGEGIDLMNPYVNAIWAAKYLKYQLNRYENDWCKASAAYNAGSFNESKLLPGRPRNLKYVNGIKRIVSDKYKERLACSHEPKKIKGTVQARNELSSSEQNEKRVSPLFDMPAK